MASATRQPVKTEDTNGLGDAPSHGNNEELKIQLDEAVAAVSKQKEQIEALLTEIKGLQDENSTFKIKVDTAEEIGRDGGSYLRRLHL